MQNTTLGEVIKELQQQYEVVGNIPVKLLENELSLVLVYDEEPEKEPEYVVYGINGVPDKVMYVVDELGYQMKFGDYHSIIENAYRFSKDKALALCVELSQVAMVYKFDIMRVDHD